MLGRSKGRALAASRPRGAWLRVVAVAGVVTGMLALGAPVASVAAVRAPAAQPAGSAAQVAAARTAAYRTAMQYVIRFWPRWISFAQTTAAGLASGPHGMLGAETMGPQFRIVNLINNDTLYSSVLNMDLRSGPAILTIPPTTDIYSISALDIWGDVFPLSIKAQTPGTYALVLKGWRGTLPRGVTKVVIPYPVTMWNFRADNYSPTGVNMIAEATAFRAGLRLTSLADYEADPNAGPATIIPLFPALAFSFKVAEDTAATLTPNAFLRQTQRAVASATAQPISTSDLQLSAAFNQDFAAAQKAARRGNPIPLVTIDTAVRAAYTAIVEHFLTHYIPGTKWIHFTNIAAWGTAYLDRAATTEFCQLCNNFAAAGYWQAFVDGAGQTLNGARHSYQLTFPAGDIPQAKRFWSVTAYTPGAPGALELIPNPANKYLVARYTPGLVTNPDGSITITMSVTRPAGVPMANWLPVRRGQFNIALRVYGPTGNTASPDYAPPRITVAP